MFFYGEFQSELLLADTWREVYTGTSLFFAVTIAHFLMQRRKFFRQIRRLGRMSTIVTVLFALLSVGGGFIPTAFAAATIGVDMVNLPNGTASGAPCPLIQQRQPRYCDSR